MRDKVCHGIIINHRHIFRFLVMGFLKGLIIRGGMLIACAWCSMEVTTDVGSVSMSYAYPSSSVTGTLPSMSDQSFLPSCVVLLCLRRISWLTGADHPHTSFTNPNTTSQKPHFRESDPYFHSTTTKTLTNNFLDPTPPRYQQAHSPNTQAQAQIHTTPLPHLLQQHPHLPPHPHQHPHQPTKIARYES